MTFTQIGSKALTTNVATYFTGTWTIGSNALAIAFVSNVKATAANTGSFSGFGLNWVQGTTLGYGTNTNQMARLSMYWATTNRYTAVTGIGSWKAAAAQTGWALSMVEIDEYNKENPFLEIVVGSKLGATIASTLSVTSGGWVLAGHAAVANETAYGVWSGGNKFSFATAATPPNGVFIGWGSSVAVPLAGRNTSFQSCAMSVSLDKTIYDKTGASTVDIVTDRVGVIKTIVRAIAGAINSIFSVSEIRNIVRTIAVKVSSLFAASQARFWQTFTRNIVLQWLSGLVYNFSQQYDTSGAYDGGAKHPLLTVSQAKVTVSEIIRAVSTKIVSVLQVSQLRSLVRSIASNPSISMVVNRLRSLLKTISSISAIQGAVSRLRWLLRSNLTQISQTLSVSRLANYLRSTPAGIPIVESVKRIGSYLRIVGTQIASVISIARSIAGGLTSRTVQSIVSPIISLSRIRWINRAINSVSDISHSVSRALTSVRTVLTQVVRLSTVVRVVSYLRYLLTVISENMTPSRISYYLRTVSSQISYIATVIRSLSGGLTLRTASTVTAISHSVSRLGTYLKTLGFTVASAFSVSEIKALLRTVSTSVRNTILVTRMAAFFRNIAQSIGTAISVVRSVSGGMTVRLVSTTMDIAVNVSRIGRYLRTINEIIASSYAADKLRRVYRAIVGIVPVSVALNRIKTFVRFSVVTIAVLFSTMRIGYYLRVISSSITSGHLIGRIGQYIRSVYYYAFPIEVVISDDSSESHGNSVRDAVIEGYGSNIRVKTRLGVESYATSIAKAVSMRASALVRSFAGVENHLTESDSCYPTVLTFWPLGSNSYVELTALSSIPVSVTSGGGTTQNDTAYGDGLEFWDDGSGGSSAANGRIAGKLLKIKHSRGGSWWDARYAARQTASNGGTWDKFNGYGKIDVAAAIAYGGSVPADDYANGNPELGQIQNIWVVGTWLPAWQTYFRNVVTLIGTRVRVGGNPILTLIYKILSKFINIDRISSGAYSVTDEVLASQFSVTDEITSTANTVIDEITSTTKEVD